MTDDCTNRADTDTHTYRQGSHTDTHPRTHTHRNVKCILTVRLWLFVVCSSINHVNYVIANNFPAHGEHVLHRQIVAGQANSGTEPLNHWNTHWMSMSPFAGSVPHVKCITYLLALPCGFQYLWSIEPSSHSNTPNTQTANQPSKHPWNHSDIQSIEQLDGNPIMTASKRR